MTAHRLAGIVPKRERTSFRGARQNEGNPNSRGTLNLSDQSLFEQAKKWGGLAGSAGTLVVGIFLLIGQMSAGRTHVTDTQQQQQQDIQALNQEVKDLRAQVAQTNALLSAITQFRDDTIKRLDLIQGEVEQELRYHHR